MSDLVRTQSVGFLTHNHILFPAEVPARLVNGSVTEGGRLEIFYNGSWGSVCDDLFTEQNAKVACKMLGYSEYVVIFFLLLAYSWHSWQNSINSPV